MKDNGALLLNQAQRSDSYAGVRAVVTGASGFIGRWVARALVQRRAELHLVVRPGEAADSVTREFGSNATIELCDLAETEQVVGLVDAIEPAIVFNLAGYGVDPAERDQTIASRINVDLVEALCRALARTRDLSWNGQALVHVGSALEYGSASGNLSEQSAALPTTMYGRSKLAGTEAVRKLCGESGLPGLTARLFTVYGPGEHHGRLLPSLMRAAETGEALPLTSGRQRRDFTYVEDVAAGLLLLASAHTDPGDVVNLATGTLQPVRHFAITAAELLNIPLERLEFGALAVRGEEMAHQPVAVTRLKTLTGWLPTTSIAEGIERTIQQRLRSGSTRRKSE